MVEVGVEVMVMTAAPVNNTIRMRIRLAERESIDDDGSNVGQRGPVAPTPLPEPRNH